jgi:hypothetical protein
MNSAGLSSAFTPVVASPNYMPVILDPQQQFGTPEIVYVTVHSGSATTATVVRGQENTAVRAHDTGEFWVVGPTTRDFNKGFYAARMYRGAAASYGAATTVLQYDTVSWDSSSSCTTGAAAAYTASANGYYWVSMVFGIASSVSGQSVQALIYVNGVEVAGGAQSVSTNSGQGITSTCTDRVYAAAGQTIQGWQNTNTGNPASQVGATNQYISISLDELA